MPMLADAMDAGCVYNVCVLLLQQPISFSLPSCCPPAVGCGVAGKGPGHGIICAIGGLGSPGSGEGGDQERPQAFEGLRP
jgi:hypothetical protein